MSEKQITTIDANNTKIKSILQYLAQVISEKNEELLPMIEIAIDYSNSTDKIMCEVL